MEAFSRGLRVQVFLGENDQVGHTPRYQALIEYLRKEGAAGATVTRGVAGFGANSRIHTAAILRLSLDLPMILTWIDAPERVARLLPGLRELTGSGIITVEEVGVASYGRRQLEQLRFDLQVRDVMTRPVHSVRADAPVSEAVAGLVGREYRALPVVDERGVLVGVVSNSDLVERAGLAARLELLAEMDAERRSAILAALPARTVRDVMTTELVTVSPTEKVASVPRLMSERRVKRVPVVDADGRLLGILSRADVLRAVAETFPRDVAAVPGHPAARTAGDIMRTGAPVVPASADLATLLDAVISTRLNRAIVVDDDGRIVGIVSDADVLRSIGAAAEQGVLNALMRTATRVAAGDRQTAGDLVRGVPVTVTPDTLLADAARTMMEQRRKVLPVVDEAGRLLGIVDRADLLHASRDAFDEIAATAMAAEEE